MAIAADLAPGNEQRCARIGIFENVPTLVCLLLCPVGTGDTQISTVDKDMARLVFSVIDQNKDGNLTVAEIDSFLKQKPLAKALLLPFAKKGETLVGLHRAAKEGDSLAEFHGMSIEVSNWSV